MCTYLNFEPLIKQNRISSAKDFEFLRFYCIQVCLCIPVQRIFKLVYTSTQSDQCLTLSTEEILDH